jgi:4,5-DOPA dioxygenase extradiol
MDMIPAIFVSHGAPTLPFDDCPARTFLRGLGKSLPRPKAILVASAHWDTDAPIVNDVGRNDTIHDFSGFPQPLYELRYPAPGSHETVAVALNALAQAGLPCSTDTSRGLDHGAWVPLLLMYPEADIPVVQLSIQSGKGVAHHIALGKALAPLREQGVLVLGTGSFTHNLRLLDRGGHGGPEPQWSKAFSDWVHEKLMARDDAALAAYRKLAPDAAVAQPTDDHFVPLFVAYGAGGTPSRLHSSTTFGSLRMDAYAFA